MKLELKHLAPYLPYKVKIRNILGKGSTWTLTQFNIEQVSDYDKPILRPLSDLTKEIEHDGEKFKPLNEIKNLELYSHYELEDFVTNNFSYGNIDSLSYQLLQKLLEWHFDVFGLIEQGLAIDVNTLTNEN